jgi:pSer/pThr/pTyr-binding forkhead associated (FHA) protein
VIKWIFLGLVYLVVALLIIGVQREMRMRLPQAAQASGDVSIGRLRVIRQGTDPRLRPGGVVSLRPEMTIGSQSDNDLVLRDRYVSAHHASLRWDGVTWWIEDLNSTNGTYVNQQRVTPGAPMAVPGGAVLEVGDVSFEVME